MVIPATINPRSLSSQNSRLEGMVPRKSLSRLNDAVCELLRDASAKICFKISEESLCELSGIVETEAEVICQRCLEKCHINLSSTFSFVIVDTEKREKHLSKIRDAWVVVGRTGDLHTLLEDELLMALPPVSYHENSACNLELLKFRQKSQNEIHSPFNVLKNFDF
ncbi:MAG: hypothetical protein CBC09_04255 [Cellvibrionales bacterium TMED49]|nr:MAG: hypothetical protein CBC09_08495 [Cellvibrionales bacterium TMED49]OUU38915.1 MAG: hypothetical protein CBC09_04255 [Cellvibrionales bacterium TMED49]